MTTLHPANPKAQRFIVLALDMWAAILEVQLKSGMLTDVNDLGFIRAIAADMREPPRAAPAGSEE